MNLTNLNISDVKIGLKVLSARNIEGIVSKVTLEKDNLSKSSGRVRFDTIEITWVSGSKSIVFHMQADAVKLI